MLGVNGTRTVFVAKLGGRLGERNEGELARVCCFGFGNRGSVELWGCLGNNRPSVLPFDEERHLYVGSCGIGLVYLLILFIVSSSV